MLLLAASASLAVGKAPPDDGDGNSSPFETCLNECVAETTDDVYSSVYQDGGVTCADMQIITDCTSECTFTYTTEQALLDVSNLEWFMLGCEGAVNPAEGSNSCLQTCFTALPLPFYGFLWFCEDVQPLLECGRGCPMEDDKDEQVMDVIHQIQKNCIGGWDDSYADDGSGSWWNTDDDYSSGDDDSNGGVDDEDDDSWWADDDDVEENDDDGTFYLDDDAGVPEESTRSAAATCMKKCTSPLADSRPDDDVRVSNWSPSCKDLKGLVKCFSRCPFDDENAENLLASANNMVDGFVDSADCGDDAPVGVPTSVSVFVVVPAMLTIDFGIITIPTKEESPVAYRAFVKALAQSLLDAAGSGDGTKVTVRAINGVDVRRRQRRGLAETSIDFTLTMSFKCDVSTSSNSCEASELEQLALEKWTSKKDALVTATTVDGCFTSSFAGHVADVINAGTMSGVDVDFFNDLLLAANANALVPSTTVSSLDYSANAKVKVQNSYVDAASPSDANEPWFANKAIVAIAAIGGCVALAAAVFGAVVIVNLSKRKSSGHNDNINPRASVGNSGLLNFNQQAGGAQLMCKEGTAVI